MKIWGGDYASKKAKHVGASDCGYPFFTQGCKRGAAPRDYRQTTEVKVFSAPNFCWS